MTKHIDLLRAHQKKRKSNNSSGEQSNELNSSLSDAHLNNPYSNPVNNEKIPAVNPIIEEEPVSFPFPQEEVIYSSNNNDFNISSWLLETTQDVLQIFKAAQQLEPADTSSLNERLRELFSQLEAKSNTLDTLELEVSRNIRNICDIGVSVNDLVQKSIMMMLYAIKIGLQLKLEQQILIHHTLAAMLHHIGMAMVPDAIRHKADKLNQEEVQLIKQAPERAVKYLESCNINDESILTAASQSSERYDGTGATGLSGRQISWSARIIGLLSMFEALIHIRPYRQRLLPRDAIRELVNHHKKAFDPILLKALIESISLYPVGTFVQLNTGEIGQVITVHNKFPLRPIVHINMDKYGNIITKREVNLKQQPNLMIKKCMYEEALEEYAL